MTTFAGLTHLHFLFWWHFRLLLTFFSIVPTSLEIHLCLDILLEPIQYIILSELVPIHVDVGIIRIIFLQGPPRSISSENIFDEPTIITFADVEDIGGGLFSDLYFDVVSQVD